MDRNFVFCRLVANINVKVCITAGTTTQKERLQSVSRKLTFIFKIYAVLKNSAAQSFSLKNTLTLSTYVRLL